MKKGLPVFTRILVLSVPLAGADASRREASYDKSCKSLPRARKAPEIRPSPR